jgi:uncharacterized repeat protein (TIGR01451 family)
MYRISRRHRGIAARVASCLAFALGIAVLIQVPAAFADTAIISAGPLTNIKITSDLNCAVNHAADSSPEFYGETACGTLVAVGGTLYGPALIPAGGAASPRTPFTPVSQSAVTGAGTASDPFEIVTVVDLGSSGLRLTETDSYVVGQESYRTDVQLTNAGTAASAALVYRAGDCFLQNSDLGYGMVGSPSGAVACATQPPPNTGGRVEQWLPITAGSHYLEAGYNEVWAAIGSQQEFPDTCSCPDLIDNGAGLSWSVTVAAAGSTTVSSLITFSPTGTLPLTASKTADSSSASAGSADGYTITIDNPNGQAVSLNSINDTLPAGFSYTAGSTSGVTTADPLVSGQILTWNGPFTVPGSGSVSLHFGVIVASTAGTYFNNAGADAGNISVAPTGDTAPVTVSVVDHSLTVTKAGTGSGMVTSSPAGIDCGATCSASFASGTTVTLTATPDAGSTFTGWSGACTGTGPCTVTMDQDRAVTATFDSGPPDPRVLKQDAVASLRALLPTGDRRTDRKIEQAIKEIEDSLDPQLWLDDSHLTDKGKKVFHEEREAANKLMQIKDPPAVVASVLDTLVAADQALARTAIDEATAAGGDPRKLADAEEQMAKASEEIGNGRLARAIMHYGRAWNKAQKAVN